MWLPLLLCDSNLHIPSKSACCCCPITCTGRQYILLIHYIFNQFNQENSSRLIHASSTPGSHSHSRLVNDKQQRILFKSVRRWCNISEKNQVTPGLEHRGGSCRAARLQADSVSCQEYEASRVVSVRGNAHTWRWLSRVPLPRAWAPRRSAAPGIALTSPRRISSRNRSRRKILCQQTVCCIMRR